MGGDFLFLRWWGFSRSSSTGRLGWRMAPAGVLGWVLGAYLLISIDGNVARPFVTAYLTDMGCFILYRPFRGVAPNLKPDTRLIARLGVAGGFADAAGGGGWGPVVSSTLVGTGGAPRYVIGTVNATEFLLTGHWDEAGELTDHA